MHSAVFAAAVEVLLAGGGGRGEVASYEGFENFVSAISGYAAVLGVPWEEGAGVVLQRQMCCKQQEKGDRGRGRIRGI